MLPNPIYTNRDLTDYFCHCCLKIRRFVNRYVNCTVVDDVEFHVGVFRVILYDDSRRLADAFSLR